MALVLDSDTCPDVGRHFPQVGEALAQPRIPLSQCIQNKGLTSD
jgi:hypothetical protein